MKRKSSYICLAITLCTLLPGATGCEKMVKSAVVENLTEKDGGKTAEIGEEADTGETADSGKVAKTEETADIGKVEETVETADTGKAADIVKTAEIGEAAETADTGKIPDTEEAADTVETADIAEMAKSELEEPTETETIVSAEGVVKPENTADESNSRSVSTLASMIQAPEKYKADFTTKEGIRILADAPILVPDADSITLKSITPGSRIQEHAKDWLKLLANGETSKIGNYSQVFTGAYESSGRAVPGGIPYQYSYFGTSTSDLREQLSQLSFLWHLDTDALAQAPAGTKMETFRNTLMEHTATPVEEDQKKVEALLEEMGISDMRIFPWRTESVSGHYLDKTIRINDVNTFRGERMVDGIPLTFTDPMSWDANPNYEWADGECESVIVSYIDDTLSYFSYRAPYEVTSYSDEKLFLLPFEEIQKIFENNIEAKLYLLNEYLKSLPEEDTVYENVEIDKDSEQPDQEQSIAKNIAYIYGFVKPGNLFIENPEKTEVTVTEITLGYKKARNPEDPTQLLLIPVWDFFGTWTSSDPAVPNMEIPRYSLLTIDARDGSIVSRKRFR